jgi:hypothetical protein
MFTSPTFNFLVPAYFCLTFFTACILSFLSLPLRYIDILYIYIYIYIYKTHIYIYESASVLKQMIIKRKLLFSQWRLACRFPGPACRGNHTCDS